MTTINPIVSTRQPRMFGLEKLALRQRSSDHPMVMFALASGMALMSMAFASASGSAVIGLGQPMIESGEVNSTQKQDRLPAGPIEAACHGQTWGAESSECLVMIAREAGRGADFKVRKLASAQNDLPAEVSVF
jgi:hypothetical protein